MKRLFMLLVLLLSALCLSGCFGVGADSSTKGLTTSRQYDVDLDIRTEQDGVTFVSIPVSASSEMETSGLSQDTANTGEFSPITSLTQAIESMVSKAVADATSSLDEGQQENKKKRTETTTTTTTTTDSNNDNSTESETNSSVTNEEEQGEEEQENSTEYEAKFHHTQTGSSDGGKSLVLCPGQTMEFDSCSVGDTDIPRHSDDEGRETYWNMSEEPSGDIICEKDGKEYKYPASKERVNGKCS